MDRRTFLLSSAVVPLVPHISWADGWSEYLPCGQLVQFTEDDLKFRGEMRRRGINYALGMMKTDPRADKLRMGTLRFSFNATCHNVDVKDGLASEDDWERYHFKEIAN